jgi:hypothetical protein
MPVMPPFQAEHTFLFEPVETAIGVLPRNAGERANLLLLDLKMRYQVRVEHWIEQRSKTAGDTSRHVSRAAGRDLALAEIKLLRPGGDLPEMILRDHHDAPVRCPILDGWTVHRNENSVTRDAWAEPGARRQPDLELNAEKRKVVSATVSALPNLDHAR